MIVYVESNFVLELALLQAEAEACASIVRLAEEGRIALVLPAFSVAEPYEVLRRHAALRADLRQGLTDQLRQLSRTRPYEEKVSRLVDLLDFLVHSSREERERLDRTLVRVLDAAEAVPVDADTLREAAILTEDRELSVQDSIIYVSVLRHLRAAEAAPEKRFLNRNAQDFLTRDIKSDLAAYSCAIIPSFGDGLGWIRGRLSST